jgi:serine/threonine protein kinase
MEHVEGLSLAELIEQSGRLLPDRAASVMVQVTDALAAAWKVGVVHRDVKPGNILLARDGTAKLADLGLALIVADERADDSGSSEAPEGTVAYMSPEQARASSRVDFRADVYSLGATFYHAVTGRLPFSGRTRMEVLLKHAKEDPPPPHQLVPELSPSLSQVILRMLAKRPEDRHPTYADLRSDLLRLFEETDGSNAAVSAEATASGVGSTRAGSGRSLWKVLLSSFSRKKASGSPKGH